MSTPTRDRTRTGPYRDDLRRIATFQLARADGTDGTIPDDGLTIDGYGAVFNSATEIDSWEGCFEEEILPGAFKKSLREGTPKMQFDHGRHPLLGSLPLGVWDTAEEDAQGLHVIGRLTDNWLVQPFRDAIADGGVDGMSFRFSVVRDQWFDKDGKKLDSGVIDGLLWSPGDAGPLRRKLAEVKVSEVGPVMWPAYDGTSVDVRHLDGRRAVVIDLARLTNGNPNERARLAKLIAIADRATGDAPPREHDPQTPDAQSGAAPAHSEPRSTEKSADVHPPAQGAPHVTDTSAGEHSSPANGPANPTERRSDIRARFRLVTDRVLALPPSS